MGRLYNDIPVGDQYPNAESEAAVCLRRALDRLKREEKRSLRSVARELGYKQPVTISHMANGRMLIPVERAHDIALVAGIDPEYFQKIVLKQRYPNVEFNFQQEQRTMFQLSSDVSSALGEFEDGQMPSLSQSRVIREVLRDERAAERWLSPHELLTVQIIRRLRNNFTAEGLSAPDLELLRYILK